MWEKLPIVQSLLRGLQQRRPWNSWQKVTCRGKPAVHWRKTKLTKQKCGTPSLLRRGSSSVSPKNSNNRKIASARGMMKRGKRRFFSFPFPSSLAHFFFLLPSKPTAQGPLCLGEIGKPIEIKVPVGNSKPAPRTATNKMEKRSKLRQG